MMLEYDIISAMIVLLAIVVLIRYVFPCLKNKGFNQDLYKDIELGLLLFGYAFREEKVKYIINIITGVVASIEKLDITPINKKEEAVEEVFTALLEELDIELDARAIEVLINIAVSYLPPTN